MGSELIIEKEQRLTPTTEDKTELRYEIYATFETKEGCIEEPTLASSLFRVQAIRPMWWMRISVPELGMVHGVDPTSLEQQQSKQDCYSHGKPPS